MISPCGLFWVAKIPDSGLNFSSDGKTATLEMKSFAVFDQSTFPALDAPATPAEMNFKIVWKATNEPVVYDNPQKQFRFKGFKAAVQMEASVRIPSRKEKKGYLISSEERDGKSSRRMYRATDEGKIALAEAKEKVKELFGEMFEDE